MRELSGAMSGAKRGSKYRKGVTEEYMNALPEPEADEAVAKVRGSRGANIFEVEVLGAEEARAGVVSSSTSAGAGKAQLALLPNRFKNVIWVKRNDYLIVKNMGGSAEESNSAAAAESEGGGGGVQWEVQHILSKDQIKHLKSTGKWPEADSADPLRIDDDYAGIGGELGDNGEEEEEAGGDDDELTETDARGNTVFASDA